MSHNTLLKLMSHDPCCLGYEANHDVSVFLPIYTESNLEHFTLWLIVIQ